STCVSGSSVSAARRPSRRLIAHHPMPIAAYEMKFVIGLILGDPHVEPAWVAGLVHNRENAVDFDKIDYLMRDSKYLGYGKPIQIDRLLLNMRVLPTPTSAKQPKPAHPPPPSPAPT